MDWLIGDSRSLKLYKDNSRQDKFKIENMLRSKTNLEQFTILMENRFVFVNFKT